MVYCYNMTYSVFDIENIYCTFHIEFYEIHYMQLEYRTCYLAINTVEHAQWDRWTLTNNT